MKVEHYENHAVTLRFPTSNEMQKAVNSLASAFKFEISSLSDYDICKWIDDDEVHKEWSQADETR